MDEMRRAARFHTLPEEAFADMLWTSGGQDEAVEARRALGEVAALSPAQRKALVLVDLVGHSHAEAALICGCTPSALTQRLARARAALQPFRKSA